VINKSEDPERLLERVRRGDKEALAEWIERVYPQLKEIVAREVAGERTNFSRGVTEVLHDLLTQLLGTDSIGLSGAVNPMGVCTTRIRRILIDYSLARGTRHKHGLTQVGVDPGQTPVSPPRRSNTVRVTESLACWFERIQRVLDDPCSTPLQREDALRQSDAAEFCLHHRILRRTESEITATHGWTDRQMRSLKVIYTVRLRDILESNPE
jgi:hypothetical protein